MDKVGIQCQQYSCHEIHSLVTQSIHLFPTAKLLHGQHAVAQKTHCAREAPGLQKWTKPESQYQESLGGLLAAGTIPNAINSPAHGARSLINDLDQLRMGLKDCCDTTVTPKQPKDHSKMATGSTSTSCVLLMLSTCSQYSEIKCLPGP